MHIHIITDLEGISGIGNIDQINQESENYRYTLERLMSDVNAAINGAFLGGADSVSVTDGHMRGKNFIDELLDKRALKINLIDFYNRGMHKTTDAFMFVGTHAMPGTLNGFLDHCQSSTSWYNYYINGMRCGEMAQGGAFCGAYGIPVVMASGDEAACEEAKNLFGDIAVAPVKKGIGRNKASLYDLDESVKRIENAAKKGVGLVGRIKPLTFTKPLEIKVEFMRSDYCDNAAERPGVTRVDARCVFKNIPQITDYMSILI